MDNPDQLESHLQLESSKFEEAQPPRSKSPTLSSNDDPLMLPFSSLSHLLNLEVLFYLDFDQLRSISHLCRLFYSEFLKAQEAREVKIHKARCNFIHLPFEIWALEIISRLRYNHIKKLESICTTLRDHIHNYRPLRVRLHRGQVDNESLLREYQELESRASQEVTKDEVSHSKRFKVRLHPAFYRKSLKYHISREKDNTTSAELRVRGHGLDENNVKHFRDRIDWILEEHQIGSETATTIPVGWFRFDFEEKGKQHRGTSDRYPITSGKPRAVTVLDVISKLIELKGGMNLADWYRNNRKEIDPTNRTLWKESIFSPVSYTSGHLVKVGNSVGIEIKGRLQRKRAITESV